MLTHHLLDTIWRAEPGTGELLDAIQAGLAAGLDVEIDSILNAREREVAARGRRRRMPDYGEWTGPVQPPPTDTIHPPEEKAA